MQSHGWNGVDVRQDRENGIRCGELKSRLCFEGVEGDDVTVL